MKREIIYKKETLSINLTGIVLDDLERLGIEVSQIGRDWALHVNNDKVSATEHPEGVILSLGGMDYLPIVEFLKEKTGFPFRTLS